MVYNVRNSNSSYLPTEGDHSKPGRSFYSFFLDNFIINTGVYYIAILSISNLGYVRDKAIDCIIVVHLHKARSQARI